MCFSFPFLYFFVFAVQGDDIQGWADALQHFPPPEPSQPARWTGCLQAWREEDWLERIPVLTPLFSFVFLWNCVACYDVVSAVQKTSRCRYSLSFFSFFMQLDMSICLLCSSNCAHPHCSTVTQQCRKSWFVNISNKIFIHFPVYAHIIHLFFAISVIWSSSLIFLQPASIHILQSPRTDVAISPNWCCNLHFIHIFLQSVYTHASQFYE